MNRSSTYGASMRPMPRIKRVVDLVLSAIGLIVLAVLFPFIALALTIESKGPVIFKARRVGHGGRVFIMYKFRTMVFDAQALLPNLRDRNLGGPHMIRIPHDPRVTRVGGWLRRTGLDELPQFLNVLKGEMSVVGPRPQSPDEMALYDGRQRRRLEIMPGITGLWQVTSRQSPSFNEWVRLDLQYIDSWSVMLDLKILIRTAILLLSRKAGEI